MQQSVTLAFETFFPFSLPTTEAASVPAFGPPRALSCFKALVLSSIDRQGRQSTSTSISLV
jgi:hypothetical protein